MERALRKVGLKCKASLKSDMHTLEIAVQLHERLCQLMGGRCPALVLNQIHRKKMDPNRPLDDAAQGSRPAVLAFFEYHGFINATVYSFCGPSLFIDIHGHTHAKQRAELGYLVYSSRLRSGDFGPEDTSINSLVFHQRSHVTFENLLRGQRSLGGFMNREGLRATPSPNDRAPAPGDSYFSGGYSVQLHGSRSEGTMDAIQIEISREQRSDAGRPAFVEGLAKALRNFINTNKYA
ncbi:hypothetical protein CAPTEDRAFT_229272 [Capitella teleta]|uniref:Uncharacterized protein n=1 Tax=Capitella teleta TaxID=283909 RepID=R7ULD3_CAPTE|nr:hypothetical protein CAPTEDRAFT_229272 [Capitella teleta]|eukprot:ELU06908.1 hypothetical protein CAPTEDRAFT_229272 [Capitella teleta]